MFLKEIEILILTDHPNIIRIYEYYFDDVNFYLITEYVSGGELYDTILSWKSFDEEKAAYIMSQILSAVNYLHKQNIVHRDIKPENMLVENKIRMGTNKNEMINIKLIDFGTCNFLTDKNLTLKVGSPYYIAPEVLKRNYNEKCDVWSCGIILYILLVGYPPFSGVNTTDLLNNVAKGDYSLKSKEWKKVSKEAKDLVRLMLEINPSNRISAEESLNHPWIKNAESNKCKVDINYFEYVIKNMCEFNAKEKLQQATIAYIVHFLYSSQEIDILKNIFRNLDKDGDGILSYGELRNGIEKCFGNYKNEVEMNKIIQIIDNDNSGTISYEEFLRVSVNQSKLLEEKNLKLAFDRFDTDKDGRLSKEEIKQVLITSNNDYISLLLNCIDQNNDGYISFEEFSTLMNGVINHGVSNRAENNLKNDSKNYHKNTAEIYSSTGILTEIGCTKTVTSKNAKNSDILSNSQIERHKVIQQQKLFDEHMSSSDSSVVGMISSDNNL
jgi:calcium-dependent protein kinase